MISQEQILTQVTNIMVELFELDAKDIKMESRLNEDLGLDSIDAIDLITSLQSFVGRRLQPEDFKSVRTISDLIKAAESTLNQINLEAQNAKQQGR